MFLFAVILSILHVALGADFPDGIEATSKVVHSNAYYKACRDSELLPLVVLDERHAQWIATLFEGNREFWVQMLENSFPSAVYKESTGIYFGLGTNRVLPVICMKPEKPIVLDNVLCTSEGYEQVCMDQGLRPFIAVDEMHAKDIAKEIDGTAREFWVQMPGFNTPSAVFSETTGVYFGRGTGKKLRPVCQQLSAYDMAVDVPAEPAADLSVDIKNKIKDIETMMNKNNDPFDVYEVRMQDAMKRVEILWDKVNRDYGPLSGEAKATTSLLTDLLSRYWYFPHFWKYISQRSENRFGRLPLEWALPELFGKVKTQERFKFRIIGIIANRARSSIRWFKLFQECWRVLYPNQSISSTKSEEFSVACKEIAEKSKTLPKFAGLPGDVLNSW